MADTTAPRAEAADIAARRALTAELGATLRHLTDEAVCTEAPEPALASALEAARQVARVLQGHRRPPDRLASLDNAVHGARIHNPAAGPGNPIAPPLRVDRVDGDAVEAVVELGRAYEGPPGFAHGGVTALLLDEVLGRAVVEADRFGMTAGLTVHYRRPVPLRTPILLRASVSETRGRTTTVTGTVRTQDAPGTVLVEATGLFVQPPPDKREAYFGGLVHADGSSAADYRIQPSPQPRVGPGDERESAAGLVHHR
ncbi:PaaI family thioesterase [Streptomyces sp. NPDC051218]|uniref:PaaI family thioesterase n=1 Tax=Streptomyces sp. NPDC051218 TaxID=3365645 RepID=UPI00378FA9AA